ncbi:hypothetical protein EBN03_16785 [Nocardia stercoris]|uniref:Uncharacterized protein n=1 Tax=Nocardia stercoris TaxID=2483361 RepID=A0A3M2L2Q9_9NOCA|nr:hypothetical protein EBN03_16785 [Nocardia stercoris]
MCLIAVVLAVSGCGSSTPKPPPPAPVDLSQLDVGNLPTQPKDFGKTTTVDKGRLVEAARLGNYVPLPAEIDPALKFAPGGTSGVVREFISFDSAAIRLRTNADPGAFTAAAPGFVSGFVISGSTDRIGNLAVDVDNVVMIFTDDKAAAAAATGMGNADFADGAGKNRVTIDQYPGALAYTGTSAGVLTSWFPYRNYVILTAVDDNVLSEINFFDGPGGKPKPLDPNDLPRLTKWVTETIHALGPQLDKFPLTPQDKLTDLDVDLDGVLSRTLPTAVADTSSFNGGIPAAYDAHGGLQVSRWPDHDIDLFRETGVDRVAKNGGTVYRAKDPESAEKIAVAHTTLGRTYRPAAAPRGLPNARCTEDRLANQYNQLPRFYCSVTFGRYAADVAATQLADAQQRISAQYAILVNSK